MSAPFGESLPKGALIYPESKNRGETLSIPFPSAVHTFSQVTRNTSSTVVTPASIF